MKRQVFANHTSDKESAHRIHKELFNLVTKGQMQFKNRTKDVNRHVSEEHKQMVNKHMENAQHQ